MGKLIGFKATEQEVERVEQLTQATGLSKAALLRELVNRAELRPVQIQTVRPVAELRREQAA